MKPPFEVWIDAAKRWHFIAVRGVWDLSTADAFRRASEACFSRYQAGGGSEGSLVTLVDLREGTILPREVLEEVEKISARYTPFSRRIAMVMSGSVLHLMQSRRIVCADDSKRFFTDEQTARAWLEEAFSPARAPSADRRVPAPHAG